MRKTFAPALVLTLLVLGAAGAAWAVQTDAEAPQAPAEAAQPAAPEASPLSATSPEEIFLDGLLFPEAVEVDACCFADCRAAWNACKNLCPPYGHPDYESCHTQCLGAYDACLENC